MRAYGGRERCVLKRESKKKPYRSAWSNALWSFHEMLRNTPLSFWLMVGCVPLGVFLEWAGIRLPALVVEQVTTGQTFTHAAVAVGLLLGATLLADALRDFLSTALYASIGLFRSHENMVLYRKTMRCFYQRYESKPVRDLYQRAAMCLWMNEGIVPLLQVPQESMKVVQNLLCYFLFGTVISFVSPWLVVLLTAAPMVNWFCVRAYNRFEYGTREARADLEKKLYYTAGRASDFTAAKDLRVYGMTDWLRGIYRDLTKQYVGWQRRLSGRQLLTRLIDLGVILVRDGAAYLVLIRMTVRGELSPDQFVLYFAAISSFATFIGNIMTSLGAVQESSLKVSDFREYMDLSEGDDNGTECADAHLTHAPEITFDHVSFRYEGAAQDTLHDLSFTFHPGERIALVGMNGAGKTTLVKLLCGLYSPTVGQIRIDGVPTSDFKRREYYRLFSPVFQDVETPFFSLAETVAADFSEHVDRARAEACMRRAGLGKKLDALPQGIDSRLDKQVNEDGIELSGGETQKLMMARALYKDAPILVLDEPTAALDPIAENEIYLQYRDMTERKTSLFISHRLASTRFCDRILYLDGGQIAEEGTHDELIARGGSYARLYEIQSCWYREDYKGGETA